MNELEARFTNKDNLSTRRRIILLTCQSGHVASVVASVV